MKKRAEYSLVITYLIPVRELGGTAQQIWDFEMGIFRDLQAAFPGCGCTVTRRTDGGTESVLRVEGPGSEEIDLGDVERVIAESELRHAYTPFIGAAPSIAASAITQAFGTAASLKRRIRAGLQNLRRA